MAPSHCSIIFWGDRRGSNPHPLGHNQMCKPLHHGHRMVGPAGVAPAFFAYQANVLLLNYEPMGNIGAADGI